MIISLKIKLILSVYTVIVTFEVGGIYILSTVGHVDMFMLRFTNCKTFSAIICSVEYRGMDILRVR